MAMVIIFILSLLLLILPLLVYPLWLWILGRHWGRPHRLDQTWTPTVSLIVACRNPGELLAAKITNTFDLDYPNDRLELVIVADGSTDGSESALRGLDEKRIRFRHLETHGGKAHALNVAMGMASGEVLVFSDVDALLAPSALRLLLRHFGDPIVGGVCGQRILQREQQTLRDAQMSYVDWDSRIKSLESAVGSMTSNDGKLYALRAQAASPIAEGVTDDLDAALKLIGNGWRFVFEPDAMAVVRVPARSPAHEISRRRRVVARSLGGLRLHRQLLDPRRSGLFAISLGINKGLRRLLPIWLLLLLASNAVLAPGSWLWSALLALQISAYGLAGLGAVAPRFPGRLGSLSRKAFYFVLGNYGTLLGLLDFLRGRKVVRWDPDKGVEPRFISPPTVAYTMSRFPKLTETFILLEILALIERGYPVQVCPLLRERTGVRHADVDRVMPYVHWLPFLSAGVLWSNLSIAISQPGRYWGTLSEMVRGTWPSSNYFIGGLAIWPKSVHLARQLEQAGIQHLHAHFANHPALAAWIVWRLSGIGYSFTAHGSDLHIDQTMLGEKIDKARFVVTISEYNRGFIEERLGRSFGDKLQVVHCGIDTRLFTPNAGQAAALDGTLRILCVAALRDVKGHRHLIDACGLLRDRQIPFRCLLVGDGPLRTKLKRQIDSLGLSAFVRMLGPLPREAVLRQMREDTDVVALTSILAPRGNREGIPVTLMEAMACGLPVVSSRLSGIPELVEDSVSGLLTEPGRADEIAAALARLAAHPELRSKLGAAGRERVLSQFNIETNVRQFIGLLQPYLAPVALSPAVHLVG